MNTCIRTTLCLLALLSIAHVGAAAPAAPPASATDVVGEYLADRSAKEPAKAYALLSGETQKNIPLGQFNTHQEIPADPTLTPALRALFALVLNTDTLPSYDYQVTGIDPSDAATVLVSARPKGDAAAAPALLKIVTVSSPGVAPRIDFFQSLERTAPEAFRKMREAARAASSMSNMKQIALAIVQYAQAHNERLPDADRWVDEVAPYMIGSQASPSERERVTKSLFRDASAPAGQQWSYAFNRSLSGLPLSSLKSPAGTVLVFESTAGTRNAADTGTSLPHPGRHSGGSYFAFADGHVVWVADSASTPDFTP